MSQSRLIATNVCLGFFAISSANGAMGLGMEMWDYSYWYPYVIATLILEGWMIGVWLELRPLTIVFWTIFVNLVTALFCCGGPLATVGLHSAFVGTSTNPNPFMNGVFLLSVYALPSAVFEYAIWERVWVRNVYVSRKTKGRLFWRVIFAHLLGIPLGLAILLIPERPYIGLEGTTGYHRRIEARKVAQSVADKLNDRIENCFDTLPDLHSSKVQSELMQTEGVRYPQTAFTRPVFTRFSTGRAQPSDLEWNESLANRKLASLGDEPIWMLRSRNRSKPFGMIIQVGWDETGRKIGSVLVSVADRSQELGFKPEQASR